MESKHNRDARIRRLYDSGLTLTALGKLFNLTRQRIDQIVNHEKAMARQVAQSKPMADGQPCQVCSEPAEERHHDNYDEPLDFRWLCKHCHNELHRLGEKHTPIMVDGMTITRLILDTEHAPAGTPVAFVDFEIQHDDGTEMVSVQLPGGELVEVPAAAVEAGHESEESLPRLAELTGVPYELWRSTSAGGAS